MQVDFRSCLESGGGRGKNRQEQKKKRVERDDSSVLGVELGGLKLSHHELIKVQ